MNNEVYKEVYGHILNDAQRIRREIMNEWGDILMFGGTMPDNVVGELSTAARITGLAFDALASHGVEYKPVSGKPDLFTLTVREENYVCHKTAIPSMSGFLDVVNIPGVSSTVNDNQSASFASANDLRQEEIIKEEATVEEKVEEFVPSGSNEHPWSDIADETEESVDSYEETDSFNEEENVTSDEVEENASEVEEEAYQQDLEETNAEDLNENDELDEGVSVDNNSDSAPNIGSFMKSDMFVEEREKKEHEFVYEMFGVSMTHSGFSGGGKSLDAQIMIAPLKIQKFSCPSVPIIVSVYYKGKIITSSSYDQAEDGRNLVTLNIDEFYLLFRGSYDGNGKFRAFVTTTGISASQGDILNITSEVRYGDDAGRDVRNGHVKFRDVVYDDMGTIEVFPFGDPEENEFIVMTKTDEFVDYMYISDDVNGLKKALMYQNGNKVYVDCKWDEDIMKVTLKEV